jgi:hypothetical protein
MPADGNRQHKRNVCLGDSRNQDTALSLQSSLHHQHWQVLIAERCYAALGDIPRARYLHKVDVQHFVLFGSLFDY